MNSYIILDNEISISIDLQPYLVDRTHPKFDDILQALREENWDVIPELVNVAKSVEEFGKGKLVVDEANGTVKYGDEEIDHTLTVRLLKMMREGFNVTPLTNFIDRLMKNPSMKARRELYTFLDFGKMPITPDGYFIAYKSVNDDYTSMFDSKTDNTPGAFLSMSRSKVDDRSSNTCSYGLHFCSHSYLSAYRGARIVVLKVDPADVVSIPTDYNNTKGRACRYAVIGELTEEERTKAQGGESVWDQSVNNTYEDRDVDPEGDELEEASEDYQDGYRDGYTNARKRPDAGPDIIEEDLEHAMKHDENGEYIDYLAGHIRGYKDGVRHKRKVRFA